MPRTVLLRDWLTRHFSPQHPDQQFSLAPASAVKEPLKDAW